MAAAARTTSQPIDLLHHLGLLVEAEFGALERVRVQQAFGPQRVGVSTLVDACRFLECVAAVQGGAREAVYQWAGSALTQATFHAHPQWAASYTATVPTLLQVGQLAPVVLRGWLPGAVCPEFAQQYIDGYSVQLVFDGPDALAWLVEGVVQGLGRRFGESVATTREVLRGEAVDGVASAEGGTLRAGRWQLTARVRPDRRRASRTPRLPVGLSSRR